MSIERKRIGSYRVLRVLGVGGMGTVYEAEHLQIARRVAIKVLHGEFSHNPELVERFLNEARAVNEINHAGVIKIVDADKLAEGTPFLVMELLAGHSLAEYLLHKRTMPMKVMLDVAQQLAESLRAAHARLIVHRDLKPDNIMLIPDLGRSSLLRTKIVDFGIAKLTLALGGGKTVADYLGTPTYSAPEQIQNPATVDEKADVYSLGCILYECAAGVTPFVAESPLEMMAKQLYATPRRLNSITVHIGVELSDLIESMLDKDRAQRPNMDQVLAVLREVRERCADETVVTLDPRNFFPPPRNTVPGSLEPILPEDPSIGFDRAEKPDFRRTSRELFAVVIRRIGQRWRWMWAGTAALSLLLTVGAARSIVAKSTQAVPAQAVTAASLRPCRIEPSPDNAQILLPSGDKINAADAVLLWTEGTPPLRVEVSAPGHRSRSVMIDGSCSSTLKISLTPLPQPLAKGIKN